MIDLKQEQEATLARPRRRYGLFAKLLFLQMDLLAGFKTTPGKAKLIEMLATVPYRRWEIRAYGRMTRQYQDAVKVRRALAISWWGREAQDNEYWHLLILDEKMKQDGLKDPWYLWWPITFFILWGYVIFSYLLALFWMRKAFQLNADFEDHAEHVYAQFVKDNPGLDEQPVNWPKIKDYDATVQTWGDVFRRVGLDERDHMNNSLVFAGQADEVVVYAGMPTIDPGVDASPAAPAATAAG